MIIKNYNDTKTELNGALTRLEIIKESKSKLELEEVLLNEYCQKVKKYLINIEKSLKSLSGIEYRLYYEIVISGLNVTKAIDKVSFDVDKDVSTIWKSYYPRVKKIINDLPPSEIL